jgi:hypothetical protein
LRRGEETGHILSCISPPAGRIGSMHICSACSSLALFLIHLDLLLLYSLHQIARYDVEISRLTGSNPLSLSVFFKCEASTVNLFGRYLRISVMWFLEQCSITLHIHVLRKNYRKKKKSCERLSDGLICGKIGSW